MTERELFQEAIAARKHAYAPYSGFYVGAAIETTEGVVWGCNIENSSYSMTICAERVAIFRAVADGKHHFKRIAIAGGKDNSNAENSPCFPCGACLQVLAEFCVGSLPIILADGTHTLEEFLPKTFHL